MFGDKPVRALGAMSGTSLDGVDAAVLVTNGETITAFGPSAYRPYTQAERAILHAALGKWPSDDVAAAAEVVETAHAQLLSQFEPCDLIGFHGQTLAHDPGGRGTHQAGDGGVLAEVLKTPVVWDFRSADVQLGGQGAPLVPFYHFALAKWIKATTPLAILNLGGVGNMTWIDPRLTRPDEPGALMAFDTGPANAPLNDLMLARRGLPQDDDGALAATGTVDARIITDFLRNPYFYRMPPKSLDRNTFSELVAAVAPLDDADAAATLTAAAAMAVSEAMQHCPRPPAIVYVAGGGRKNPTLMSMLRAGLDCPVQPIEDTGLDGDMIEAQAFAFLAVRVARGLPTTCPGTTAVRASVCGGTLSKPKATKSA
jgi:anhydro-N-acetylmuramic acid kinase